MPDRTCIDCGSSFRQPPGRGRPRIRCFECSPRQLGKGAQTAPKARRQCWCGEWFEGIALRKYCSYECRQLTRMTACAGCGNLVHRSRTSATAPRCLPCRRATPAYRSSRRGGAEAHECQRCGQQWQRPATKGQRPKRCPDCRVDDRAWIPAATRRAVYERDDWECQICRDEVDRALVGSLSPWRPSLDHIIPRSQGGSDGAENLRLAHFWCNGVLNDGRAYTDDDFRLPA